LRLGLVKISGRVHQRRNRARRCLASSHPGEPLSQALGTISRPENIPG
jgi:hypothetical protein